MSIFMTVLKVIAISILVLIGLGLSYQYIATKLDERKYPSVGKLVDIGGYKLHMIEDGIDHTGPVVIIDGGAGACALDWSLVQPEIAKFARVITYDRAGYGWSDASPLERTSENIVEELRTMLKNAGVQGPYILVGHSFGGFNMQLFAAKYPDQVAGIILVDASNENTFEQIQQLMSFNNQATTLVPILSYLGILRLMHKSSSEDALIKKYSQTVQDILTSHRLATKYVHATIQEGLFLEQNSFDLKRLGTSLGDIPLTVISAGKPFIEKEIKGLISQEQADQMSQAWFDIQADLVTKSSRSKQVIAKNSGHQIYYDQPEIVVDAVRDMVVQYQLEHFDDAWGQLGDPALIEQRFLELLPQAAKLQNKSIYLQMLSQVALAQAVSKKFDTAHTTLDQAEKLLTPEYDLAKVRILCERGRAFQQAGDIAQAQIYFEKSYELSAKYNFDKQTINAAHMIAIVTPTSAEKIAWNCKALNLAMHTDDASARSWCGPILNNLGANYLEDKQLEKALDAFRQALIEFEKSPEHQSNIRFAKFRIAQILRMLGRLDEALKMLQLQLQEYKAMTTSEKFDMPQNMFVLMRGWLYEELVEVYAAKNNRDEAIKYAQLALVDLDHNQLFAATDPECPARVEKLKRLGGNNT